MSKQSPVAKKIHYEGLTMPVGPREIYRHRQKLSSWQRSLPKLMVIGWLILFGLWGIGSFVTGSDQSPVIGGVLLLVGGGGAWLIWRAFRNNDIRAIRLGRFAHDNSWSYERESKQVLHQGMIFQIGHSRRVTNVISCTGTDQVIGFELGEYTYTVGSGKNRRTYWWTYCCVELDRHVPHMVLDAQHNNVRLFGRDLISNLPATFRKDQVISLEGDFDKYFTLYAPTEYKRDAYYIFTPDLMARLIDTSRAYDAEVIDNRIYFYAPSAGRQRLLLEPNAMYQWLRIIDTIGTKIHRQTDYYADETVADRSIDHVATGGYRLKRGVSWTVVVILLLYAGYTIINILSGIGK